MEDEILEFEFEETTLDEILTSDEMANLISALAEWDSHSLVGQYENIDKKIFFGCTRR